MSNALNAKPTEAALGALFNNRVYAAIADIDNDSERENPFSDEMWQTYANLQRSKDDQFDGLSARFTVQSEVKQHLTFLFGRLITELRNVELEDTDTAEQIIEKLEAEHAESFGSYVFIIGEQYKDIIGKILREDVDVKEWIRSQLKGQLPAYAGRTKIYDTITTGMELFIKATAWLIAKVIWYKGDHTINSKFFLAMLSITTIPQVMLDEIQSAVRAKKPSARKKKTTSIVESQSVQETPDNTEITDNTEPVDNTDTADSSAIEEPDDTDVVLAVEKKEIAAAMNNSDLADVMANF